MSAKYLLGLAIIALSSVVDCRLENHFTVSNLVVHDGTYTQFRLSGFGYGDESLENEISQVKAFVNFTSNLTKEMEENKKRFNFDLFVFSEPEDY